MVLEQITIAKDANLSKEVHYNQMKHQVAENKIRKSSLCR